MITETGSLSAKFTPDKCQNISTFNTASVINFIAENTYFDAGYFFMLVFNHLFY